MIARDSTYQRAAWLAELRATLSLGWPLVLATLARNFSIEHAEDQSLTQEVFAFTMMPSRLHLRLRPVA